MTKDLVLAPESENWPAEKLKPVIMTFGRKVWHFWVIEGTALADYNMAFMEHETAENMLPDSIIGYPDEAADEGDDIPISYESVEAIPSVLTEDGKELLFGLVFLGEGVMYENEEDDPNLEEDEPEVRVLFDLYMPGGLNARDRAKWKVRNLLTSEERSALFGDPDMKWIDG